MKKKRLLILLGFIALIILGGLIWGFKSGKLKIGADILTTTNLVAHYKFDEGQGTTVSDSSGHNNNGTITGAGWSTAGKVNSALDCKGGYADIPNSNTLQLTGGMTTVFWLKSVNLGASRYIILDKSSTGEFALTLETTGALTFYQGGNPAWTALDTNTLVNDRWQMITITRDASTKTLTSYINGHKSKSTTYSIEPSATTNSLRIGEGHGSNKNYDGMIDELRLYNKALDENDILSLYSADIGPADSSHIQHVGYWDKLSNSDLDTTMDYTNTIFLRAYSKGGLWRDLEDYKISPAYNKPDKKLIIFTGLTGNHYKTEGGETIIINDSFPRIKDFLDGKYTDGVSMRDRVLAVQLIDEPTSAVLNTDLDDLVTKAKSTYKFGVPLTINYIFDNSSGSWNNHIPAELDYVSYDPYITPQASDSEDYARFERRARTRLQNIKNATNKPIFLIAQSYYSQHSDEGNDNGSFTTRDRILTPTEENWYYELAGEENVIIGFFWWTFGDSKNWSATESYRFYGSAQDTLGQDPNGAIMDLHIKIGNEIKTPRVGTITPLSGTSFANMAVTFTTTYTDADGWQNIQNGYFLVNTTASGANSLYVRYDQNANKLYLKNNANSSWGTGCAPGSNYTLSNSYATLYCASTTKSGSGNTLTVEWRVSFKSRFRGSKNTYLYVIDDDNLFNDWTKKGTWIIR